MSACSIEHQTQLIMWQASNALIPVQMRPHTMYRPRLTLEDNGFTEFHGDDTVGWVLPFYRRCYVSVSRTYNGKSNRMLFWPRRIKLFRLFTVTIVIAVHLSSSDHRA